MSVGEKLCSSVEYIPWRGGGGLNIKPRSVITYVALPACTVFTIVFTKTYFGYIISKEKQYFQSVRAELSYVDLVCMLNSPSKENYKKVAVQPPIHYSRSLQWHIILIVFLSSERRKCFKSKSLILFFKRQFSFVHRAYILLW